MIDIHGLSAYKIPRLEIWANLADEFHNANSVSIQFFEQARWL
jgi:hypothetical protein